MKQLPHAIRVSTWSRGRPGRPRARIVDRGGPDSAQKGSTDTEAAPSDKA